MRYRIVENIHKGQKCYNIQKKVVFWKYLRMHWGTLDGRVRKKSVIDFESAQAAENTLLHFTDGEWTYKGWKLEPVIIGWGSDKLLGYYSKKMSYVDRDYVRRCLVIDTTKDSCMKIIDGVEDILEFKDKDYFKVVKEIDI